MAKKQNNAKNNNKVQESTKSSSVDEPVYANNSNELKKILDLDLFFESTTQKESFELKQISALMEKDPLLKNVFESVRELNLSFQKSVETNLALNEPVNLIPLFNQYQNQLLEIFSSTENIKFNHKKEKFVSSKPLKPSSKIQESNFDFSKLPKFEHKLDEKKLVIKGAPPTLKFEKIELNFPRTKPCGFRRQEPNPLNLEKRDMFGATPRAFNMDSFDQNGSHN